LLKVSIKYPEIYRHYNALSPISEDEYSSLIMQAKPVIIKKGETLFSEGDAVKYAYAVQSGIIKVAYNTHDGKEFIKSFQTAGHVVVPYMEGITGVPSRTSASAITETKAVCIPFHPMIKALNSTPALLQLHVKILQFLFLVKDRREYQFLTMDATARYKIFLNESKSYIKDIPNTLIAAYIGITPVSLSRLRAELNQKH